MVMVMVVIAGADAGDAGGDGDGDVMVMVISLRGWENDNTPHDNIHTVLNLMEIIGSTLSDRERLFGALGSFRPGWGRFKRGERLLHYLE